MPLADTDRHLTRDSYYAATAAAPTGRDVYAPVSGSARCDVAIVGGGLAGLSAALELAQRGLDVRLLEAQTLGYGASGRNGGQAIHGYAADQELIEQQLGADDARRLWDMSIEALDLMRSRIARHGIDCHWRDGFLGLAVNARKGRDLMAWAERTQRRYAYPLQPIPPSDIGQWIASKRFHSGVYDARSGHCHPLRYTQGLAQAAAQAGAKLHEASPVTELVRGPLARLCTPSGTVEAKQVLLAGNVYLRGLAPELSARIMPVGTYIACTEALPAPLADSLIPSRAAACDTNFVLDYFRTTDDHRMLYGGRVSYSTVTPMNLAESMRQRMLLSFPQLAAARIEYAWGGFVDISMSRAPDFGRLPALPGAPANIYYLQGFSGHGLALTGLAGQLVAEAMTGDAGRFDVFTRLRHRPFPGGRLLRTPSLVLGMAWYRLRDMLS